MNPESAQKLSAFVQSNAVTKNEITRIHQTSQKISETEPVQNFEKLKADGHSVTFLQKDALFEKSEPKLVQKMVDIMTQTDNANWKLIANEAKDNESVNIRVIEYHHYRRGGGLTDKTHYDGGSILTAVVMLSDPSTDFEGGENLFWECDGTFTKYEIKQGDMIIFPSHKFHCVSTVTKGERYVMVIELWKGPKGNDGHRTGGFSHLIPAFGMVNMF